MSQTGPSSPSNPADRANPSNPANPTMDQIWNGLSPELRPGHYPSDGRVDIPTLLAATDLVALIGECVAVRKAGHDFQGLCPFHNEKTASFTISPTKQFFHCLAGDTEVITFAGTRKIADLAGAYHRVLTDGGVWVDAPFKCYGTQHLWEISLSRNGVKKSIFATDGHRWLVHGRSDHKTTDRLSPGDCLESALPAKSPLTIDNDGVRHGIVFGDGCLVKKHGYCLVNLHDGKSELESLFEDYPVGHYERGEDHDYTQARNLPGHFKQLPSIDASPEYIAGFVAGYLATDGHVSKDSTVMLHCRDADTLRWVRDACLRIGVATFGVTHQDRCGYLPCPTPIYRIHFVTSTLLPEMILRGTARERFDARSKKYERLRWKVQSVEKTDRVEPVYCAEVPDTHSFALADNILTGNCFGCGAHGDALTWMQDYHHMTFRQALEALAGRAGMSLPSMDRGEARKRRAVALQADIEAAAWPEILVLEMALSERVTYRAIDARTRERYPHIKPVPDLPSDRERLAAQRLATALYALYGVKG